MTILSGPRGTRDFYPENMALQEFIFSTWKKTCSRYGFEPYEGPMFESLQLFTRKSGPEIEEQLYAFQDKKGRELALRPEMTPTLARMVAAKGRNLKLPIRWYSIPRVFRYEKMQKGRLREFFQLNMDILGIQGISADAELIAAAIDMMISLGFSANDFKVRISSRTLLEELFIAAGLPAERCPALYALLDKKSKLPEDEFSRELSVLVPESSVRTGIENVFQTTTMDEIKGRDIEVPAAGELRRLFETLALYRLSEYIVFDIGIVRGLAYYTGIVFEVFDSKKNLRAIAGGGRYDRLVELYGGPATPATGFAAGDVVISELMREKGIIPPQPGRSTCYIISIDSKDQKDVIALARELRANGIGCEFALKNASIEKQFKLANAARSPYALILGGEEQKAKMVRVKNMLTGEESFVSRLSIATSNFLMEKQWNLRV